MALPNPRNRNFIVEIYVPALMDNLDISADLFEATGAIENYLDNYLRDNLQEILTKCNVKWKEK